MLETPLPIFAHGENLAQKNVVLTFGHPRRAVPCNQTTLNMKKITLFVALVVLLGACQGDKKPSTTSSTAPGTPVLSLLTEANPAWQHENLRLYPIVADAALLDAQRDVQNLKTLAEGMKTAGFRITEQKQFGRSNERTYNILTVQNKSRDTIFMMSGDVVTGGNQDRVIAQDQVVAPHTVKNVDVFCVEQGRWQFTDSTATPNEKAIYAFRGYYNVASPQVRQAVHRTNSQGEVWAAVARVTEANGATSKTSTYAALETAADSKAKRDAYLRQLSQPLAEIPNVVGIVAVSGDRVLGVDVFGHPDLFLREYPALLHGFAAEAATGGSQPNLSEQEVQRVFGQVARLTLPTAGATEGAGKFARNGRWVHLYSK